MLPKHVTLAATLLAASSTNAFLLPPEVADSDIQIADAAAVVAPSSAEAQLVKLDCPGCPLVISGPLGTHKIRGKPNHLELTFRVDHQHDGDHLVVNGFELFPNPIPGVLTAPQIPDFKPKSHGRFGGWHHRNKDGDHEKHDGNHEHKKHGMHNMPFFMRPKPAALGFALRTNPTIVRDPDSQLELVTVDFQVIEVANDFVSVPELHVKLIKDASGRLMISNIEQSLPAAASEEKKCDSLLCKWLEAIFPKRPAHPCHRQQGGPGPSGGVHTVKVPSAEDPNGRWGPGMQRDHSWGKLFKNITQHILLPVLIGIVAGVSISVIGMAIGTVVVYLWRTFVRRPSHRHHRRRSSHHHKAPAKEAAVEEEKSGLMAHQDAPPSYDDEVVAGADDTKADEQV